MEEGLWGPLFPTYTYYIIIQTLAVGCLLMSGRFFIKRTCLASLPCWDLSSSTMFIHESLRDLPRCWQSLEFFSTSSYPPSLLQWTYWRSITLRFGIRFLASRLRQSRVSSTKLLMGAAKNKMKLALIKVYSMIVQMYPLWSSTTNQIQLLTHTAPPDWDTGERSRGERNTEQTEEGPLCRARAEKSWEGAHTAHKRCTLQPALE